MIRKIKDKLVSFFCFFIPVYLIVRYFNNEIMASISKAITIGLNIITSLGLVLILFELWKSDETTDEKLFWTITMIFLMPITLPLYWYEKIYKRRETRNVS